MSTADSHFATPAVSPSKANLFQRSILFAFQIATFYPYPGFISHKAFTENRRLTQQEDLIGI